MPSRHALTDDPRNQIKDLLPSQDGDGPHGRALLAEFILPAAWFEGQFTY